MKTLATLSLISIFTSSIAFAGGFGGPAPFRNESPLPTGTDGVYQAVASATNLTGIFGFALSGGFQTSSPVNNSWIFFVDGTILRGQVSANLSSGKVTGILDAVGNSIPTTESGTLTLPLAFVVPSNSGSGYFSGTINMKSPVASFKGSGSIAGAPARIDQIVFIEQNRFTSIEIEGLSVAEINALLSPVRVAPVRIPGSTLDEVKFKFRGSRLSTSVSSTQTPQGGITNQ